MIVSNDMLPVSNNGDCGRYSMKYDTKVERYFMKFCVFLEAFKLSLNIASLRQY